MLCRSLFVLFLFCAGNLAAQQKEATPPKTTQKQNDAEIDYKQPGAPMPPLVYIPFYSAKSKVKDRKEFVTGADLNSEASLIIMMFNPTCGHCQDMTRLMCENYELFKSTKVLLLANSIMKEYLPDFVTTTRLEGYHFMSLGVDSMKFIDKTFLYQSLPQINIYNADRRLMKTYTGEVPMDTLRKYIQ